MSVKPISPEQVVSARVFPDGVIEAFNEAIAAKWDGRRSVVVQDDVIELILKKCPDLTRNAVFAKNLLDVEPLYESMGWDIKYDKPAYNETYNASWTFKRS